MAKLLWIGPNTKNAGRRSSKAYLIRRRGKSVVAIYGSVESVRGASGRLRWSGPLQTRTWRFRSAGAAIDYLNRKIRAKLKRGYERRPRAFRIYPHATTAGGTHTAAVAMLSDRDRPTASRFLPRIGGRSVTKVKLVSVGEGEGRDVLLGRLDRALKHERITAGDYLIVIAKLQGASPFEMRPKATRKRRRAGYRY